MSFMTKSISRLIMKYKRMSLPAKAGLWFTISAFIQRGITFITTPIYTRILTTEQYGIVSVYNTWVEIISILCTMNLYYGGFNNGMRDYKNQRDEYVSSIQGLITTITICWGIVFWVGQLFFKSLLEMDSYIIILMFLQIIAYSSLALWASRERYEFRYRKLVLVTVSNTLFSLTLPIIAVLLSRPENGASARIVVQALCIIIFGSCLYFHNLRKGRIFYSSIFWKTAFLFNLPLLPHYLSTMILNHSDRIMISKMVGSEEAALYSVAYSGAMVLNILTVSINQSFAPWIYGKIEKKRYENIGDVSNGLFLGVSIIIMLLIAFAPEFLLVLGGRRYADAVIIVPPVAASLYFVFMYQIFANVEFYFKRNYFIAYASIIGAVINVILNFFGIKLFGYIAPGYTTLICYIIFGISHYIFMKRICVEEKIGSKIFDSKAIFSLAFILVAFSLLMALIYEHLLIRYAFLGVLIVILVIKRKYIYAKIKMIKK